MYTLNVLLSDGWTCCLNVEYQMYVYFAQWLCHVLMLLPFQGVITFRHVNPGCRYACPGHVLHWAFSPPLLKLELVYIIMFKMSRYALVHSFAHRHRFHRSRSPLKRKKECIKTRHTPYIYYLALHNALSIHIGIDSILFNKLTTRTYIVTH